MNKKNISLDGSIAILYHRDIDDLAEILSKEIFGGIKFTGKKLKIRDEFNALIIHDFFGIEIVLTDSGGIKNPFYYDKEYYHIDFSGVIINEDADIYKSIKISDYLYLLFKSRLEVFNIDVIQLPVNKKKYPNLL